MPSDQISSDIGKLTAASEGLAVSLDALRHDMHRLASTVTDNGQRLATVDARLSEACGQINDMSQAVMRGNGQPPLVSRVQQNADRIESLGSTAQTILGNCQRHANSKILTRNQVILALIGLLGAVCASCASLIVTLLSR